MQQHLKQMHSSIGDVIPCKAGESFHRNLIHCQCFYLVPKTQHCLGIKRILSPKLQNAICSLFQCCLLCSSYFGLQNLVTDLKKKKKEQNPNNRAQFTLLLLTKLLHISCYYREQIFPGLRLSMKKAWQTTGNQTYARK